MTSTEIANASKIMLGSTEAIKMYIGSTLIWEPQVSTRYDAEIEYLEVHGYLYIDLNIVPDENTGIYIQAVDSNQSGDYDHYATGLRDDSGNTRWCIGYSSNLGWYYGYGGFATISNNAYPGSIATSTLNYLNSKTATCAVNGTTSTVNLPTLSFTPQNNIRIFGTSGISAYYTKWSGKIYSFKVSQGSTVIMDLIPVRVGKVGYMYDKIGNLLYSNDGDGIFTLGPDKILPPGYTELEYISSTSGGNLYIDLGIKLYETLNTNYDIAMKFNIASGNANQAAIFACQDSDNDPWPGTFVRVNSSSGKVIGRYIGGTAKDNTLGSLGADIELPVQTSPNKNVTSLNNNNSTHQYGTSLFCAFVGGTTTPARYCNAKLYYFKLFVNGALVRNLIPCKDSNDVVGMYDVVNDVFYTSPNGASFVAGPVVSAGNATCVMYTEPTLKCADYTGSALELINTGQANKGTFFYSTDNTNWSTTTPTATSVGAYDIYWKFVRGAVQSNTSSTKITSYILRQIIAGTDNGHDYVDFNLISHTKWATINLCSNGNSTIDTDNLFTNDGCRLYDIYGDTSIHSSLGLWGGNWSMPTKTQFEELVNHTVQIKDTVNGLSGYRFIASNCNYIFLPAYGAYRGSGDGYHNRQNGLFYWTSTLYSGDTGLAWCCVERYAINTIVAVDGAIDKTHCLAIMLVTT